MEDRYIETHKTWNTLAQRYEDKFMELDLYNDTYEIFCNELPKANASVLEIGCGPGNITRQILNLNPKLKVLATDISKNMIALAKKNNPEIDTKILDGRHLKSITMKFDGIVCGFTIPYLAKPDCSNLIADCSHLLKENGILYLSFVSGNYEKSGFITGSSGDRTYFYFHELETIKHDLELNQFIVKSIVQKDYKNASAVTETHTIIIAKK